MNLSRHFLHWDEPFQSKVLSFLKEEGDLSSHCLIVPTHQTGRQLKESFAKESFTLAPKVITPDFFLQAPPHHLSRPIANQSIEVLAWMHVLEQLSATDDWEPFTELFPQPPSQSTQASNQTWSFSLANSLTHLRQELLDAGILIAAAAHNLESSMESERWNALAQLERRVESCLTQWGYTSRSVSFALNEFDWHYFFPPDTTLILVGLSELSELACRHLRASPFPIKSLIAAPTDHADAFDLFGRPLPDYWEKKNLPWPEEPGSVHLTETPFEQAQKVLQIIAEHHLDSHQIALGSGDQSVSKELTLQAKDAGWTFFNPSEKKPSSFFKWLHSWVSFLQKDDLTQTLDLLSFPQTQVLIKVNPYHSLRALSSLRNQYLVRNLTDLTHLKEHLEKVTNEDLSDQNPSQVNHISGNPSPLARHKKTLYLVRTAIQCLRQLQAAKNRFLKQSLEQMIQELISYEHEDLSLPSFLYQWVSEVSPLQKQLNHPLLLWIQLLLQEHYTELIEPPSQRVLDIHGWVDLFFKSEPHLFICGFNERFIPSHLGEHPFLPESTRQNLGLKNAHQQLTRDRYLFFALLQSRPSSSTSPLRRVDLLLSKSNLQGEPLKPSCLLLQTKGKELAKRVQYLFRSLPVNTVNLDSELEDFWKWNPHFNQSSSQHSPKKFRATQFSSYLQCPYRFYLQHICKMEEFHPDRGEWNARDFGTLLHNVLEAFANHEEVRNLSDAPTLSKWLSDELQRQVFKILPPPLPLALNIQLNALRQRLHWFADLQVLQYQEGWRIIQAEENFSLSQLPITGQIDRIEQNQHTGEIRILDYKTKGRAEAVEKAHLVKIISSTSLPPHLEGHKAPFFHATNNQGKEQIFYWKNLQIPLYMLARPEASQVGYFTIGETRANVNLSLWEDFGEAEKESALQCADWIIKQVNDQVFWPPNPKPIHDPYQSLALSKTLQKTTHPPG